MGNFDELLGASISIPDAHERYCIGKGSDDFNEIRNLRVIFSFEYACMDRSRYAFNYKDVSAGEYKRLIDGLRKASGVTYEFMSANDCFHFHDVNWPDVDVSESTFYKCIKNPYNGERDLTVYQFKVFGDARAFGFIYRSVFYLVLLDWQHKAYGRDRPQRKGKHR